jgi:hypothetical protein
MLPMLFMFDVDQVNRNDGSGRNSRTAKQRAIDCAKGFNFYAPEKCILSFLFIVCMIGNNVRLPRGRR